MNIVTDTVVLVAVVAVLSVVLSRRQTLRLEVLAQLLLLLLAYVGYNLRAYYNVIFENLCYTNTCLPAWLYIPYETAQVLYLTQHWIFTALYLKVALTFELALTIGGCKTRIKRQRRKQCLLVTNLIMYTFLLGSYVALLFHHGKVITQFVFAFSTIFMTLVLTVSMRKMYRFARILRAHGIVFSSLLLSAHLASFWLTAVLTVASCFAVDALAVE